MLNVKQGSGESRALAKKCPGGGVGNGKTRLKIATLSLPLLYQYHLEIQGGHGSFLLPAATPML